MTKETTHAPGRLSKAIIETAIKQVKSDGSCLWLNCQHCPGAGRFNESFCDSNVNAYRVGANRNNEDPQVAKSAATWLSQVLRIFENTPFGELPEEYKEYLKGLDMDEIQGYQDGEVWHGPVVLINKQNYRPKCLLPYSANKETPQHQEASASYDEILSTAIIHGETIPVENKMPQPTPQSAIDELKAIQKERVDLIVSDLKNQIKMTCGLGYSTTLEELQLFMVQNCARAIEAYREKEKECEGLTKEYDELQARVSDWMVHAANMEQERDVLNLRLENEKTTSGARRKCIKNVEQERDQFDVDLTIAIEERDKAMQEIDELRLELAKANGIISNAEKDGGFFPRMQEMRDEIVELRKERDGFKQRLDNVSKGATKLEQERDTLKAENKQLRDRIGVDLNAAQDRYKEEQKSTDKLRAMYECLEHENKQLRSLLPDDLDLEKCDYRRATGEDSFWAPVRPMGFDSYGMAIVRTPKRTYIDEKDITDELAQKRPECEVVGCFGEPMSGSLIYVREHYGRTLYMVDVHEGDIDGFNNIHITVEAFEAATGEKYTKGGK
jgi:hypothetical protein